MPVEEQISMCTEHYQKWKDLALATNDMEESRKALKKAFFWLELQTAFMAIWTVEQTKGKNPEVKKQLIMAKTNLSKKLADYANEIWNELNL